MEQPNAKKAGGNPDDLTVEDKTVKVNDTRVHEIPIFGENGEVAQMYLVPCKYGTRVRVPKNIGLQFLKHNTFTVATLEGKILKPLELHEGGDGGLKLAENETVANYDELSEEALFRRCHILANSEKITDESPREEMVDFLKAARKAVAQPAGASPELLAKMNNDILGGNLTASELSKLVTDSPLLTKQDRAA